MPSWTQEQQEAIDKEGINIIVSAGAGSGKTAVLSERALRKVKSGVDVNRLLILTFTKAAAYEMMLRIRDKIKKAGLVEQVEKIEQAYITTFDSFALSVVKRYHAVLNISKQVSIIDDSVISLVKKELLDTIFEEFYERHDSRFEHLIHDFCIKDDYDLKNAILKINEKLDMKYNKTEYLSSYLDKFTNDVILKDIPLYEAYLKRESRKIIPELEKIRSEVEGNYYETLYQSLSALFESRSYEDYRASLECKMPALPCGCSDMVKKSKEKIVKILDSLREKCIYETREEIIDTVLSTKEYIEVIIEIIKALDQRLFEYKHMRDIYEFVDISKLAIQVVKEHPKIQKELRDSFSEIMIDEYQDTSDLQEDFIQLIENNNVYMVGDIKQSIYRFRNANPYIFKEKYDNYSLGIGGYKIDLVKNFRSRKEVLEDINLIFDLIMDHHFGGADYSVSHRMFFGNQAYLEEGKTNQNYKTEIYNYTYSRDSEFTREEIEAFMVVQDIKEKINYHYQIFDKDTKVLRDIEYRDFVILMDRSSKFELYKKIFEYEQIPLAIFKDENIMNQIEIYLVHHLIRLVLKMAKKEFDDTFRYSFLSVGRSYLFEMSDQELFTVLRDKTYSETRLYQSLEPFVSMIDVIDIENFLVRLIDEVSFYTKLIRVGNVDISTNNLEYIIQTASNLKKLGFTLEDFSSYLMNTIESEKEIKLPVNTELGNSVKIMTIHKSKGLEYPICYYTGLSSIFNVSDLKEQILYDNKFGIITPYFRDGYGDTIYKSLLKEKFYEEEISEKIRLFYVALTRCKEKMIIIADLKEEENQLENGKVEDSRRFQYNSFVEFLKSIYNQLTDFIVEIDFNKIPMSLDYKKRNSTNLQTIIPPTSEVLSISDMEIQQESKKSEKFSKTVVNLLSREQVTNLELGRKFHEALEYLDFNAPNWEGMDPWVQQKLKSFLEQPILSNRKQATLYKEYEFIEVIDDCEYHGVIDLMLMYDNHVDIIDYKLKKVTDFDYRKQLEGYRAYIQKVTKLETDIYLYSILDEKIFKL